MPRQGKDRNEPLPANVRHVEGTGWQVLVEAPYEWHSCRTEQDACFIASGMRVAEAVNHGTLQGQEVADELDAVAAVAVRALGPAAARQLVQAAALARGAAAT